MAQMTGKYQHERSENIDEYYKAVGVPYIPRKIIVNSNPSLEIAVDEDDVWTITVCTMMKTNAAKFKLNEEYEEYMPGGELKSVTTKEGDKMITVSIGPNGAKVTRIYEFTDTHCILTLKHAESGSEAKRYFKRT